MSVSPFDDPEGTYRVLVNERGQYSLWPAFAAIPPGWRIERADVFTRDACLEHIAAKWKGSHAEHE